MRTLTYAATLLFPLALAACSGKTVESTADAMAPDSGVGPLRHPDTHRPIPNGCGVSAPEAPSPQTLPDGGDLSHDGGCTTDPQCGTSAGIPGHCIVYASGTRGCNYDECTVDTDCSGRDSVCSCQGQTRGYAGASPGNRCITGNCRVDSDCGSNGFCSPSTTGLFYGTEGWYCHTANDECVNPSDCADASAGPNCAFVVETGHWACISAGGAG
jgi:hypothetical protein